MSSRGFNFVEGGHGKAAETIEGFTALAEQEDSLTTSLTNMRTALQDNPGWQLKEVTGRKSPRSGAVSKSPTMAENDMLREALRQSEMALGRLKLESERAQREQQSGARIVNDVVTTKGEIRRLKHELADVTMMAKKKEVEWAKERQQLLRQLEDRSFHLAASQRYLEEAQDKTMGSADREEELREALEREEARTVELSKQVTELKSQYHELHKNAQTEASLLQNLRSELNTASEEKRKLADELEDIVTRPIEIDGVDVEVMRDEMQQLKDDSTRYLQQLTIAQADFSEKEQASSLEIASLQGQLTATRERADKLEADLTAATSERDQAVADARTAGQKAEYMVEKVANAQVDKSDIENRHATEISGLQDTISQLESRLGKSETLCERLRNEVLSTQADVDLLTETKKVLLDEKEALVIENRMNTFNRSEAETLEEQLHDASLKIDAAYRYNRSREAEVEQIRHQMTTLSSELKRSRAEARDMAIVAQRLAGEWGQGIENSIPSRGILHRLDRGVSTQFVKDVREIRLLLDELVDGSSTDGLVRSRSTHVATRPRVPKSARRAKSARTQNLRKASSAPASDGEGKTLRGAYDSAGGRGVENAGSGAEGQTEGKAIRSEEKSKENGSKGKVKKARKRKGGSQTARSGKPRPSVPPITTRVRSRPPSATHLGGSGAQTARMHPLDEKRVLTARNPLPDDAIMDGSRGGHVDLPPLDLTAIAQQNVEPQTPPMDDMIGWKGSIGADATGATEWA